MFFFLASLKNNTEISILFLINLLQSSSDSETVADKVPAGVHLEAAETSKLARCIYVL